MPEIPVELPNGVTPWASDESAWDIGDDTSYLDAIKQIKQEFRVVKDRQGNIVRVPKQEHRGIMRKSEVIKGERALDGKRSYWLVEDGKVQKSITAFTDEEADSKLN